MNINPQYRPMYQQAQRMQNAMHSYVNAANPQGYALHREMANLMTDMRTNKNPRAIEGRIKTVQRQMYQLENQGHSQMTFNNASLMHHSFDNMRRSARSFYDFH